MSLQGSSNRLAVTLAAWAPGDSVFGTTTGPGAYAEYVAIKAAAIARKPSNLSFEEPASVPVAAQTAWEGLFTHGHPEKGQTILIHGGAGAVGACGAIGILCRCHRRCHRKQRRWGVPQVHRSQPCYRLSRGAIREGSERVSQEEAARHRVSGIMMRLAPSGYGLGKIGRLLEERTIRPDVATIYALKDVAQAWKGIAGKLPGVHRMPPSGPGTARRMSHGKIVLRVAWPEDEIRTRAYELYLARGAEPGRELEDWLQAERELTAD